MEDYKDYELINGGQSKHQSDNEQLREKFINRYCVSRGWDVSNLTPEQLNEIRSQKEYTNPSIILG